ncbi:class I SAM-dependent methyltransferase [Streptomyces sp. NPDC052236]|uniref:class I SAM-dependent methyltransferase n=1 Tax=Streptomyces sp. NPDC052236 TaxID=3365686 RepID=UPI0037D59E5B
MSVSVSPPSSKVSSKVSSRAASVDPQRWPDVARLPQASSRLRTAGIERRVQRALGKLPLRVRLGRREAVGLGGPLMEVYEPRAFFRRVGADGLIGLGESYMAGEWDAYDLVGVLTALAEDPAALAPSRPAVARRDTRPRGGLPSGLFPLFLDQTMSYSAALFRTFPAEQNLLPAAQHRKIDRLLDLAEVGPGTQLLEIGTGSGESAIRAAQRGARVLTVTPSRAQYESARVRVRDAGLENRVTVLHREYRRILGRFDAIVSVETVEAVGEQSWPEYFMMLDRLLAPGGRVALQAVTQPHKELLAARTGPTWLGKYVLPGGLVPSMEAIDHIVSGCTGLSVAARDGFGPHYAETLRLWRERFAAHAGDAHGLEETLRRMWTFHLALWEAGFRSGSLDVRQLLLTKGEPGPGATA